MRHKENLNHTNKIYRIIIDRLASHKKAKIDDKFRIIEPKETDSLAKKRWIMATSKIIWRNKNAKLESELRNQEELMSRKTLSKLDSMRQNLTSLRRKSIQVDRGFSGNILALRDTRGANSEIVEDLEQKIVDLEWDIMALTVDRFCMFLYFVCLLSLVIWCAMYAKSQQMQIENESSDHEPQISQQHLSWL